MKKSTVLLVVLFATVSLSACSTRHVKQHEAKFPSVSTLSFNNVVDINNVVDLGDITATATITETYDPIGNVLVIKGDGLEAIRKGVLITTFNLTGEGYQFGELVSIDQNGYSTLSSGNAFMKMFFAMQEGKPVVDTGKYLNGRKLVAAMAEYRLMLEAQAKGASAVFMPQYDWTIKYDDDRIQGITSTGARTYIYTLKITAKAINFKPDQRTYNIIQQ